MHYSTSRPRRTTLTLCTSCILATFLLTVFSIGGCSRPFFRFGADQAPLSGPDSSAPLVEAEVDAIETDEMSFTEPQFEPAPVLPDAPAGFLDLGALEEFCRDALVHSLEADWAKMQDVLFLLHEEVARPLPAGADTSYVFRIGSFRRRADLLSGLLAEGLASSGTIVSDSTLAAAYDTPAGFALPDSMLPVTGYSRSPLVSSLLAVEDPAVTKWVKYFTGSGRRSFQLWMERKAAVDSLVCSILDEYELPHELIYISVIESGLSPRARSSVGAVGPWQFMPGTATESGLRNDWWVDERRDIEKSTRAAAAYIQYLHRRFNDWPLVLAAYNSGAGRTSRAIRLKGHDNFWDLRLPSQTTDYVPKFIAAARVGEHLEEYGFETPRSPSLAYDVLPIHDATDLSLIARCAGVEKDVVLGLNPALLRGASPPDSPDYPVRIPAGTSVACRRALGRIPAADRLTWRRHPVERGETLGQIAHRYGTTVAEIATLNHIENARLIHPGDQLLIPMPEVLSRKARARAVEKGYYVPPDGYSRVTYKIKPGDTLGSIARSLGVSLTHLRKVNNIHESHIIYPGRKLYAWRPAGS